jgi:phenylalanyl-tRNA synthetase alpha subunit
MKDVPADQKKEVGAKLNDVRTAVTEGIESKKLALQAAKDAKAVEGIDITLPGPSQVLASVRCIRSRRFVISPSARCAAWASRSPKDRRSKPSGIASMR